MIIHWFRQDLRLNDNPALSYAATQGCVLPIYILDDDKAGDDAMGSVSRVWLHHALQDLNQCLDGKLSFYKGNPSIILPQLIKQYKVQAITWNRCYEPWRIREDQEMHKLDVETRSFNSALLWEPGEVVKKDGSFYKVFTPFYDASCCAAPEPRVPLTKPKQLDLFHDQASLALDQLQLLPKIRWDKKITNSWHIGESHAHQQLQDFVQEGIQDYKEGRNFPARPCVSRLSPYLHFGHISPNQIWYTLRSLGSNSDINYFCRELVWREFSYHLLYQYPELPKKNLQHKFNQFPWRHDSRVLTAWKEGRTGFPIVDAGMRELWQTGYMHNRVRMIVASFLVKNLLIDWRLGAQWFWDCLVDADLANNSMNWQWVAGCGVDAAPYFRIFNPTTQGQKFDPNGIYIRQFVPELKNLPDHYLFQPEKAPKQILAEAGIVLGEHYPYPIVDLAASRVRALEIFASLS